MTVSKIAFSSCESMRWPSASTSSVQAVDGEERIGHGLLRVRRDLWCTDFPPLVKGDSRTGSAPPALQFKIAPNKPIPEGDGTTLSERCLVADARPLLRAAGVASSDASSFGV